MVQVKTKPYIYAVDFDGTLCENKWPEIGAPNNGLIDFLIRQQQEGNVVILWTMREGKSLDDALNWCKERKLIFDAVNDNIPLMKGIYGNNPRKVFANRYIDDHNFTEFELPFHSEEYYKSVF